MEANNDIKKQIVKRMNALHLWFKDNQVSLSKELDIKLEKLHYTNNFFEKLLGYYGLLIHKARTLSNLFKGRGSQTTYALGLLKELGEVLNVDLEKDKERFAFKEYKELIKGEVKLMLSDYFQASKPQNNTHLKLDLLEDDSHIYNLVTDLIIEESKSSVQALMNGGVGGKAPEGWHEKIYKFLKEKYESSNPVTFELVIVCKEEDFKNVVDLDTFKRNLAMVKKNGLEKIFKVYLCIQNHIWLSPDFMLIDRDYIVFNWPTTLDKMTSADRTQKGFLISGSFEAIQYFRDFYEKILLTKDKCILAQDYLKKMKY